MESSSLLSDLKNAFITISNNEYIINSLNSSIITNFSLSQNENEFKNQVQNQNIIINKKSLKNDETPSSNINQSSNLEQNKKPIPKCTCKNSNCLKFYCECFASGRFCDNCSCRNCKNTEDYKELRQEKYNIIISRNPKAIQKINSTKRSWTCKCINSNCSKKYCDCFQNKKFCTSKCRCINCFNKNIGSKNDNQKNNKRIRGIRTKKNKILLKKGKKHGGGEENSKIFEEKNEHVTNKYVTPRKSKTTCDNNDIYIFYERNASTNAFTGKRERKRLIEN